MSLHPLMTTGDIRELLLLEWDRHQDDLRLGEAAILPVEVAGTLEIIGSSFLADEESIFGEVDRGYIDRELEWYLSKSLNVHDIPGGPPKIWQDVADSRGGINSNYGWMMFSHSNFRQEDAVVKQINDQPDGRRGVAIYTRPNMHREWNRDGGADFVCTNAVNYYRRDGQLHAVVQMRSNDAIFGYRNDLAWQRYMLSRIAGKVGAVPGDIIWQAGSLHIYARHYHLLEHFAKTGEWDVPVTKAATS